jgi:threonine synthase
MSYVKSLRCRECKKEYPEEPIYVCDECFGPLEVAYDYEAIRRDFTPDHIALGPQSMWRYRALLPINESAPVGQHVGATPLIHARRLGEYLGLDQLYIKNDTVNHPSLSFKDRVVATAISKAREFGFQTVACASTGNLANSVAAHAAEAGLAGVIFIPADIEAVKIIGTLVYGSQVIAVNGTYDDVNRLCTEISSLYPWAFVNINLRPYYSEGSKTVAYEIAEKLGWRTPDHIIVPVAGCSLLTKIWKGFKELEILGWIRKNTAKIYAAQASGCAPVSRAVKNSDHIIQPVKPNTIAKSLAIGNPADGYIGIEAIEESGGYGEDVTDQEIIDGIILLCQTEGIFAETAGGVVVSVTKKLVEQGRIGKDELTVLTITGNGLKTQETLVGKTQQLLSIEPTLNAFIEEVEPMLESADLPSERKVNYGYIG